MKTVNDIQLKGRDRDAIHAAVRILREHFPVAQIILYGSKAKGADDPESDIDLLVLTSKAVGWRERNAITDALFKVELDHDVVISTLVVPQHEWEEGVYSVVPIHDEVERYGVAA